MQWQTVERNWPAFLDRIEQRWPQTDQNDLLRIDGDRRSFADYLSRVHELTRMEAEEDIEDWLVGEMPSDVRMDDHRDNANIRASGRHVPAGEDVYAEDRDFGADPAVEPQQPLGRH